MSSRLAPLRLPDLWEACPAWEASGVRDWSTPLPEELERSRSIGRRVIVSREGGRVREGVVIGSAAPAVPSEGDLIRRAKSMCDRGVRVRLDSGAVHTVQGQRFRELQRQARPLEAGLSVPWHEAQALVSDARGKLRLGDVIGSDADRGGTLPYPHRAGSSPCSGEDRPARVVEDFQAWRDGEGFDGWGESEMVARARRMLKGGAASLKITRAGDVVPVAREVEGLCLDLWERWAERGQTGQRREIQAKRALVRRLYPSTAKRSAAHVVTTRTGGKKAKYGPVTPSRAGRSKRGGLSYFRPG